MTNRVRLYALSTCGWCRKTHLFLEDNGVPHEVIAVDQLDEEERRRAREELARYNPRRSYPTVVIDGKDVVTGYDEERLRKLLDL